MSLTAEEATLLATAKRTVAEIEGTLAKRQRTELATQQGLGWTRVLAEATEYFPGVDFSNTRITFLSKNEQDNSMFSPLDALFSCTVLTLHRGTHTVVSLNGRNGGSFRWTWDKELSAVSVIAFIWVAEHYLRTDATLKHTRPIVPVPWTTKGDRIWFDLKTEVKVMMDDNPFNPKFDMGRRFMTNEDLNLSIVIERGEKNCCRFLRTKVPSPEVRSLVASEIETFTAFGIDRRVAALCVVDTHTVCDALQQYVFPAFDRCYRQGNVGECGSTQYFRHD